MKFGWKDFFYFQQSEKRAILLLLILITLCLGIIFLYNSSILGDNSIQKEEDILIEFNNFQNELADKQEENVDKEIDIVSVKLNKLKEGETVELNRANLASLKRIPGIGDKYAERIIDYRNKLGGFASIEQLMEVEGISENKYRKIKTYIEIEKKLNRLRINTLSEDVLSQHPYLNKKQVSTIIKLRQDNNKISTFNELEQTSYFSPRDIDKLKEYVSFD